MKQAMKPPGSHGAVRIRHAWEGSKNSAGDKPARTAIASMPGIERQGREQLLQTVGSDLEVGVRSVLLFGLAAEGAKDATGSHSAAEDSAVTEAVRTLKSEFGDELLVMTDVCLCAYTDHGHCGLLEDGKVVNDPSLAPLAAMAVAHADAGANACRMRSGRTRYACR